MREDNLIKFFKSTIGQGYLMSGHTNDGVIGGLLLTTPKPNDYNKGCSFIIHQPSRMNTGDGELVDRTFLMMCYNQKVIETLKSLENVCYVLCRFSIHYRPKAHGYYPLCHSIEIVHTTEDKLEVYSNGKETTN